MIFQTFGTYSIGLVHPISVGARVHVRAIIFIGLRRTWEDSHRKRDSFGNVIESFKTFDDVHMCSQVNAPMSEDLE